jgi:glycine/D-amino acid oxidase-like deaminating enzyme
VRGDVVAALRGAASDFASTLARLRVRPALARRQAVQLAVHENEEEALRREHRSRDAARVETAWLTSGRVQAATGIPARGGLRGVAVGLVDPYRATLGLARAAVARGADFFEQSPVRGVRPGRLGVEVRTDGGTLEARQVVVATCGPPSHARSFNRHVKTGVRYAVATDPLDPRLRRALGGEGTVVRDSAVPPHVLFRTADHRLVAVGADGPPVAARARARTLVQRGGQLMYETSLLYPSISGLPARYVWDMPLRLTADGLPYVGPHRNFPRHLFAFACDQAGLTGALLAARILVRHFRGEAERVDLLFGFGRSGR